MQGIIAVEFYDRLVRVLQREKESGDEDAGDADKRARPES